MPAHQRQQLALPHRRRKRGETSAQLLPSGGRICSGGCRPAPYTRRRRDQGADQLRYAVTGTAQR
ncbi:hypothetical protein ACIOWG_26430, partial [Streptomyces sp. NPDC087658]|uniref:hypothetical protein n=1 Tax=Streptomyces sp. NPDC087658 TaxID=3365800 RepID=UPI0037F83401